MKPVTSSEMRSLDHAAIANGISGKTLMLRAGLAVAESVHRLAMTSGVRDLPIILLAGSGNNGGDAFATAKFLHDLGLTPRVFAAFKSTGDALSFRESFSSSSFEDVAFFSELPERVPKGTIVVDGLLGTGTQGAPRGEIAEVIRWMDLHRSRIRVLSIDIPSGLDADTGLAHPLHVTADVTVTLALPKAGMAHGAARDVCGRVEIADIGLPVGKAMLKSIDALEWIAEAELRTMIPKRQRNAHKGTFGHLLLLAGSDGFSGAATLAAHGALNSGCGLVSVRLAEDGIALPLMPPEAMVKTWDAQEKLDGMTALVAGPGMGQGADAIAALKKCFTACACPMVLDADALNILSQNTALIKKIPEHSVLTPHPGEAARLLGTSAAEVQKNRTGAIAQLVEMTQRTVVLKGADTLVGAPNKPIVLCGAGNPGMAVGGMGDVLAGLIGGLLAQGIPPFGAAQLGVWLHATAGDFAAWAHTMQALHPTQLVEKLPMAWKVLI